MNHCPQCDYSLEGLPDKHTCPECGLRYDPHSEVIPLQPDWHDLRRVFYGLVLLAMFYLTMRGIGIPRDSFWLLMLVGAGILAAGGMFVAGYRVSRRTRTSSLVLNEVGVVFKHPKFAGDQYPWAAISCATCSVLSGTFHLRGRDGNVLLSCPVGKLGGTRTAIRCAQRINHLLEVYSQASSP